MLLEQWSDSGLIGHFPLAIPPQARHVRFSGHTGYGQGGGHIQLRRELPPEEITRLETQFATATTHAVAAGVAPQLLTPDQLQVFPGIPFYTADTREEPFGDIPPNYKIYVLRLIDFAGVRWKDCQAAGVAISPERHEIIYWLEEIK